jgi:GAG-pre-integrase domain
MLTKPDVMSKIGLPYHDLQSLAHPVTAPTYVTVADETKQNLAAAQKDLLLWHWRLGHISFQWAQMLAATPRTENESPILNVTNKSTSSCSIPLCMACQLAKQAPRTPTVSPLIAYPTKEMLSKRDHLVPGQMLTIDQNMGSTPGRLPHKGKELKKDKYTGCTIFVDHASGLIFARNQVSLRTGKMIASKQVHLASRLVGIKRTAYRIIQQNFRLTFEVMVKRSTSLASAPITKTALQNVALRLLRLLLLRCYCT